VSWELVDGLELKVKGLLTAKRKKSKSEKCIQLENVMKLLQEF